MPAKVIQLLKIRQQICLIAALRIRVKIPVLVVIHGVDADRRGDGFVDLPHYANVRREKLAYTLIGEAVDVSIVERAVLHAAEAGTDLGAR